MPSGVDLHEMQRELSDRAILHCIWIRNEGGVLPAHEGWALLYERYPKEPRFLFMAAYQELTQGVSGTWTPASLLAKVVRLRKHGSPELEEQIDDLLTVAWSDVFEGAMPRARRREIATLAAALDLSADRRPPEEDEVFEAYTRLSHFGRSVLKEFHDLTIGDAPIGVRKQPSTIPVPGRTATTGRRPKKSYAPHKGYLPGEVVVHPTFGVGVVQAVARGRVEILFEDAPRRLICG